MSDYSFWFSCHSGTGTDVDPNEEFSRATHLFFTTFDECAETYPTMMIHLKMYIQKLTHRGNKYGMMAIN